MRNLMLKAQGTENAGGANTTAKPATTTETTSKVTFDVKRVSRINNGFVVICLIPEDKKKFYANEEKIINGEAPFVFTGKRAAILMQQVGVRVMDRLIKLLSLPKTQLSFDANYGVAGQEYKNLRGETQTYDKTGYNLLNASVKLNPTAQAAIEKQQDAVAMQVEANLAMREYEALNGVATMPANKAVDTTEDDDPDI